MNDEEILEAFRHRVLEEWLPAYCADQKRQYPLEGFRLDSLRLDAIDARDCMRAIDGGVVEDVFSETGHHAVESYGTLRAALEHINAAWPRLRARLVHPAYAAEIYDIAFQRLGQSGAALAQWAAARECGGLSEDEDA